MTRSKALWTYLIGALIVWVGIFVTTALVASDEFGSIFPILGGGAFWFVVIVPYLFREMRNGG